MSASRDQQSRLKGENALSPATRTENVNGNQVDLSGAEAATFFLSVGTVTDGTYTPKLQHRPDTDADWEDVPEEDVLGAFEAFDDSDSDTAQKVGYRGHNRYVRVAVDAVDTTNGATFGAVAVLGELTRMPADPLESDVL